MIFKIALILFIALFGLIMLGMIAMMFEDTETFQVIDEKLATLLRKNSRQRKEG